MSPHAGRTLGRVAFGASYAIPRLGNPTPTDEEIDIIWANYDSQTRALWECIAEAVVAEHNRRIPPPGSTS